MLEKYNYMFDLYLRVVKKLYNPEKIGNLNTCIESCNFCKCKLFGMLDLMEAMGEIDKAKADQEHERITKTFNSIDICNAYMTDGEIMVFAQR